MGYLPTRYCLERTQRSLKQHKLLVLVTPPELNGKTLLLKTKHTLNTGHIKKNQVATDLEIPSLLAHFIVLEEDTQGEDIPREKTSMVLTSAGPDGYETDPPGKTRLLGAIVA